MDGSASLKALAHPPKVPPVPAKSLVLEQNFPNPFNPTTTIRFYLPERSPVSLEVYAVSGALVRTLASGVFDPGPHERSWDGRDGSGKMNRNGRYILQLIVEDPAGLEQETRPIIMVK